MIDPLFDDDGYHSIGWKKLMQDGEDDPSGLEPHPLHCDLPPETSLDILNLASSVMPGFKQLRVSRYQLSHADAWWDNEPVLDRRESIRKKHQSRYR